MEFIKQVLGTIDITWNAICIIATPIFCYLFVMFVPVPMLLFFGVFGFVLFAQILAVPPDMPWDRIKLTIHLFVYIGTVIGLYLWCAHVVISDGLCRDITGFIPGTMDSWVQSLVPHTCPR